MLRSLQMLTDQSTIIQPCDQVEACLSLGTYYYNKGDLDQACEFYSRGYEGAESLGYDLQMKANMLLGRARAQSMMGRFASLIVSSQTSQTSRSALQTLIKWKDSREWPESVSGDENSTVSPTE